MKALKNFSFVFLLLMIACSLSGCHIFLAHFGGYTEDVTDDPRAACISRKILQLNQALLLVGFSENGHSVTLISIPGKVYMPTVENYLAHGKEWMHYDRRALSFKEDNGFFPTETVCGVLEKGTRILVSKVTRKVTYDDFSYMNYTAYVLDGRYQGQTFTLSGLLFKSIGEPNTEFIDFCEE